MTVLTLHMIDPAMLEDDDTWVEQCCECGTFDNFGELLCGRCAD